MSHSPKDICSAVSKVLTTGDKTHLEKLGVKSVADVYSTNQAMKKSEVLVKSVLSTLSSAADM